MTTKKNKEDTIVVDGEELTDNMLNQLVAHRMSRLASLLTRKDLWVEVTHDGRGYGYGGSKDQHKKIIIPKEELSDMTISQKLKMGTGITLDKVSHTLFDYAQSIANGKNYDKVAKCDEVRYKLRGDKSLGGMVHYLEGQRDESLYTAVYPNSAPYLRLPAYQKIIDAGDVKEQKLLALFDTWGRKYVPRDVRNQLKAEVFNDYASEKELLDAIQEGLDLIDDYVRLKSTDVDGQTVVAEQMREVFEKLNLTMPPPPPRNGEGEGESSVDADDKFLENMRDDAEGNLQSQCDEEEGENEGEGDGGGGEGEGDKEGDGDKDGGKPKPGKPGKPDNKPGDGKEKGKIHLPPQKSNGGPEKTGGYRNTMGVVLQKKMNYESKLIDVDLDKEIQDLIKTAPPPYHLSELDKKLTVMIDKKMQDMITGLKGRMIYHQRRGRVDLRAARGYGITHSDNRIFKNKVKDDTGRARMAVSICIDGSGSMGSPEQDGSKMNIAVRACNRLAYVLEKYGHYVMVRGFGDHDVLIKKFRRQHADWSGEQWAKTGGDNNDTRSSIIASKKALNEIAKQENLDTKVLMLFGDGEWWDTKRHTGEGNVRGGGKMVEDLMADANKEGICTVWLRLEASDNDNRKSEKKHYNAKVYQYLNTNNMDAETLKIMSKILLDMEEQIVEDLEKNRPSW